MSDSPVTTSLKNLPSPKGKLLLGHYPQFKTTTKHQFLEDSVAECGTLFKINLVGKEFLVSANPELNSSILKARPKTFRRLPKIDSVLQEMGVFGVFNAEGEDWKRHRQLTSESLTAKKVKGYYPTIIEKSERLVDKFLDYSASKKNIDIQRELMLYTIEVTTSITFGYQLEVINEKEEAFQQDLEQVFTMINGRTVAPLPIWRFYKQEKDKSLVQSLKNIEDVIYTVIAEAKQRLIDTPELNESPSNFLEALLSESKGSTFTDKEIYGNVFTMLMAGEDSTSSSIAWVIYYLAQHPEIVKKVREEANTIYTNNVAPQSYQDFQTLKYANAVVQETIRLKPTTTQQIVQANEASVLHGVEIPKDTRLILLNRYAQLQEEHFYKASEFIPERWLKTGRPVIGNHTPDVVKGFGGGPRFCPGMNLAMAEMVSLVSMLCKQFDFNLTVAPEDVKERHAFIVYPENLFVQLTAVNGL